jgi:dipeptidyl aminopeptidase/acylaminoacyl peptidase
MKADMTGSISYRTVETFLERAMRVGSSQPFELADPAMAPDGRTAVVVGSLMARLEGSPVQNIFEVDLASGSLRHLTEGPQHDRMPRWDPSGAYLAYLSDAGHPSDFQLHLLAVAGGEPVRVPIAGRWAEFLQWSPNGRQVLLVAAGQGADMAGAQGAVATPDGGGSPPWAPRIDAGVAESHWRSAWVYDLDSKLCRQVSPSGLNVWEACWCGSESIVCIASDKPSEEAWYRADVRVVAIEDSSVARIYAPRDQVGWISASPSGASIAFVEAACSDRMLVAGTLMLGSVSGFAPVLTNAVDVTFTAWQGEHSLLFAGLRAFDSVLASFDPETGGIDEIWVSSTETFGGPISPDAAPGPRVGSAAFIAEGHLSPPVLTLASAGMAPTRLPLIDWVPPGLAHQGARLERFSWTAVDGLGIDGWLLLPGREGPHPLVVDLHGGPVWRSRPRYVGRGGSVGNLLRAGYAIFQPNPRGSSGRGQDYAKSVFGDAGGADAADVLRGLDELVAQGFADPARIGVMGGSYGGFLSAWLVTQDPRFAAAVAIAPVGDWTSLRLTSHVPLSIEIMMGSSHTGPHSLYFWRSPISHAERATTPTLIVCGELDRSTPPSQGQELHHALQRGAAPSVLLTYPGEGHGVRRFPAAIDLASRILGWFEDHMPAAPHSP